MNTKLIENTQVISIPYFPELTGSKTTRVITKHFTNLAMYLDPELFALLSWLIYQSKADNSFKYSTQLLRKYSEAIKGCEKTYGSRRLSVDVKRIRVNLKALIQSGHLLPTNIKNTFIINPMLSYRSEYITSDEYKTACRYYNNIRIGSLPKHKELTYFTIAYRLVIEKRMSKKKLAK